MTSPRVTQILGAQDLRVSTLARVCAAVGLRLQVEVDEKPLDQPTEE